MTIWTRILKDRNGVDNLSAFLLGLVLLCNLTGKFIYSPLPGLISLILLTTALFRTFSKNLSRRQREEAWFMSGWNRAVRCFKRQ